MKIDLQLITKTKHYVMFGFFIKVYFNTLDNFVCLVKF